MGDQLVQRPVVAARRERKDLPAEHLGPVPAEELFGRRVPACDGSLPVREDEADRQLIEQPALAGCVASHQDVRKAKRP